MELNRGDPFISSPGGHKYGTDWLETREGQQQQEKKKTSHGEEGGGEGKSLPLKPSGKECLGGGGKNRFKFVHPLLLFQESNPPFP